MKFNSVYSDWQKELIRSELNKAFDYLNKNEGLSWDGVAKDIRDYFSQLPDDQKKLIPEHLRDVDGVVFGNPEKAKNASNVVSLQAPVEKRNYRPGNNLARFAQGKHNKMEPDIKLVATFLWLVNDEPKGVSLTEEKFFGLPPKPKMALLLSDFLHENSDTVPDLTSEKLKGKYLLQNSEVKTTISVQSPINDFTLITLIEEEKSFRVSYREHQDLKTFVTHTGWTVISPNESLFCILNNQDLNSNELLVSLGINFEALSFDYQETVSDIAFLHQKDVTSLTSVEMSNNDKFLTLWTEKNSENIKLYQRVI